MSNEPMSFKREDRYVVIKRSDLDKLSPLDRDIVQSNLEHISAILFGWNVPERECLVIESDWPEYAPAWAAIEARVTGQPAAQYQVDQEQALRAFEARAMPGDGSYRVRDGIAAVVQLCSDRRAAAQHQGEPVAWDIYWTDNGDYYFTLRHERRLHKYASDPEFKVVPLYTRPAEQPAPVAVVLPERKPDASWLEFDSGWNDCLDEVARLNPPQKYPVTDC